MKWKCVKSGPYRLCFVGVVVTNRFMIDHVDEGRIALAIKLVSSIKPTVPATTAHYEQYQFWMNPHQDMVFRKFLN